LLICNGLLSIHQHTKYKLAPFQDKNIQVVTAKGIICRAYAKL